MRKYSLLLCVVSFSVMNMMCTSADKSETKYQAVAERIDSLLNQHYTDDAPGYAMAICKDDSVIYSSAKGIADVNTKARIDENTVFNIASISKQFTAVAVLKLHELNLLSIEDSVAKFFPEFKSEIWEKVKLKHLMSHSSGIPDKRPRIDKDFMLYIVDRQCLEYMVTLDELKFEPGTNYDYINPTFQVLSAVVQRVSGEDFEDFQQENIFNTAKMSNIRYFDPKLSIPSMAHGYICVSSVEKDDVDSDSKKDRDNLTVDYVDKNGTQWMEYDYGEETFFGTKADGGIYTSVNDFIKWERALLSNIIIADTTKALAYTPHIKVSGSRFSTYQNRPYTSYGYGWFIDEHPGREMKIYHTGDNGGFQAYAAKYPDSGVYIVMLENRNDIDRWSIQTKIENILLEEGIINTK